MNEAAVRAVQGFFKPMQGVDIALKLISDCPEVRIALGSGGIECEYCCSEEG